LSLFESKQGLGDGVTAPAKAQHDSREVWTGQRKHRIAIEERRKTADDTLFAAEAETANAPVEVGESQKSHGCERDL